MSIHHLKPGRKTHNGATVRTERFEVRYGRRWIGSYRTREEAEQAYAEGKAMYAGNSSAIPKRREVEPELVWR